MLKKLIFWTIVLFFNYDHLLAQHAEIKIAWLTQGIVHQTMSGIGFPGSTINTISNVSSSNPASLSDFNNLSFGISKQFSSKIYPVWIADIGYKPINNYLPQSTALVITRNNFSVGLGFTQKYNSILDLGEYEIFTPEQPEGTGEIFNITDETIIYSYSGIFSYKLLDCLIPDASINVGMRIDLDRLWHKSRFYYETLDAKEYGISCAAGIRYNVELNPVLNFRAGLYYEKSPKINTTGYISTKGGNIQPTSEPFYGSNPVSNEAWNEYPVVANLPDKLHFGIFLIHKNTIGITGDVTKVYWSQVLDNNNDQFNFSTSLIIKPVKTITASIGFLSLNRTYNGEADYYFDINGKLNAFFITGGLVIHLNSFELEISYANSKNSLSGDWHKQVISKFAVNYHL